MKTFLMVVLFAVVGAMIAHQYMEWERVNNVMQAFMSAGPRFTADDGRGLCERIRHLETAEFGRAQGGCK